jgi:hypothetical protein
MSDPVTNVEIEDVLSSIRRLVSEEVRPAATAPVRKKTERLVLTPSLRVNVDESAARPPERPANGPIVLTNPAPAVQDETLGSDGNVSRLTEVRFADDLSADVPDLEGDDQIQVADVSDTPEPFVALAEDEQEDDEAELDTSALLSQLVEQEVSRVLEDQNDTDDLPDLQEHNVDLDDEAHEASQEDSGLDTAVAGDELSSDSCDEAAPLESKIAALEKLVSRQSDDYDGDQTDVEPTVGATFVHRPLASVSWDEADEPVEDVVAAEPVEDPQVDDADVAAAVAGVVFLSEEPSIADEEEAAEFVEGTEGFADEPLAQPVFQSHSEPFVEERTDLLAEAPGLETSVIDEEMLRGMVSDIVRQELQGVLGERITRNVRKLVRREIHRVLMSQDFE